MTEKNKATGKEKCRELRQRGGVPRSYAKWAVYLIPGYKDYWDSVWQKILLQEAERIQNYAQGYEQFEQDLRDKVELLEAGNKTDSLVASENIISHKSTKSKGKERND